MSALALTNGVTDHVRAVLVELLSLTGVAGFDDSVDGAGIGDEIALPRESYQVSSEGLIAISSGCVSFDIGRMDGDRAGDLSKGRTSSSIVNMTSFEDAGALREGLPGSSLE